MQSLRKERSAYLALVATTQKPCTAIDKAYALKQKGFLTFWNEFIAFYNSTVQGN